MTRSVISCGLLVLLGWTGTVSAQQNEPSIGGWGEKIELIQPLPAQIRAVLMRETGRQLSVGFFYRYSYFLGDGFKLWTWNGQYVLFEGEEYYILTDAQFENLLGKQEFESLRKPMAYRVPVGPIVFLLLALVIAICVRRSRRSRAGRFAREQRYQEAMQICFVTLPADKQPTAIDFDTGITAGSEFLTRQYGIPPRQASNRLKLLVSEKFKAESLELRRQGAACEMDGLWEQAEQFYELAAKLQEAWDPADADFLRKCIARVQTKQDRERGLI